MSKRRNFKKEIEDHMLRVLLKGCTTAEERRAKEDWFKQHVVVDAGQFEVGAQLRDKRERS